MSWRLRNKSEGYEVPIREKPEKDQDFLNVHFLGVETTNSLMAEDWQVIENFEFPTKLFAVMQCESVHPGGKPGLFHWDATGYWTTPHGEGFNPGYLRENFRNFKVLFEGVDE